MIPLPFSLPIPPVGPPEAEPPTSEGDNKGQPDQAGTAFLVEHLRLPERPGHHNSAHFTPAARVLVTPVLRTSGLLAVLPDEAARTLLAMLTFVTPNGRIQPTTLELAESLGTTEPQARERLERLAAVSWRGAPLAHSIASETGRMTGVLSRSAVSSVEAAPEGEDPWNPGGRSGTGISLPTEATDDLPLSTIPVAESGPTWRERVVAYSRSRYATPRAEAERLVAEQLGHAGEGDDTPEGEARRKLRAFGLSSEQAESLLSTYPLDRIQRQVSWMGMRQARDPARFLMAAIAKDYDPPEYIQRRRHSGADTRSGTSTEATSEHGID